MFVVVIPQDYHSAEVHGPFDTRKEGEDYIKNHIDEEDLGCRETHVMELTK